MGGYGSGNYYRSKKMVLEDCLCLDINRMVKQGSIQPDTYCNGSWIWTVKDTGEQTSSISYTSDTRDPRNMYLNVRYTIVSTDEKHDYNIQIECTQLHFGGHRYWFVCPYTGRRVTKLYGAHGADKYGSRHAFNLSYASQSENRTDRAFRKRWKILDKLDGEYDDLIKPKGMHWKTYERLTDKYSLNEQIINRGMLAFLQRKGAGYPLEY